MPPWGSKPYRQWISREQWVISLAAMSQALRLGQIGLASLQVGGALQYFGVGLVAGSTELLLCPPSRGGDPADDQREQRAKDQIDEIGSTEFAERIKRRHEQVIEGQDRQDDGE